MTHSQISFIVPTHDDAEELEQCLNSIASSTLSAHRVLICDDRTTKASSRMALLALDKARDDQQVEVVASARPGLAAARNTALARVRSEYVRFVDSDDLLVPHSTDLLIDTLRQRSSPSVAVGRTFSASRTGGEVCSQPQLPSPNDLRTLDSFVAVWESRASIPIHSALFRTAALSEADVWFPEILRSKEDFAFWAKIVAGKMEIALCEEFVAVYIVRGASMSRSDLGFNGTEFLKAVTLIASTLKLAISRSTLDVLEAHVLDYYGPHFTSEQWHATMLGLRELGEPAASDCVEGGVSHG